MIKNQFVPNGDSKMHLNYFKAWAKNKNSKMPSGIALTAWVNNHYKPNERDDISFYETILETKKS